MLYFTDLVNTKDIYIYQRPNPVLDTDDKQKSSQCVNVTKDI